MPIHFKDAADVRRQHGRHLMPRAACHQLIYQPTYERTETFWQEEYNKLHNPIDAPEISEQAETPVMNGLLEFLDLCNGDWDRSRNQFLKNAIYDYLRGNPTDSTVVTMIPIIVRNKRRQAAVVDFIINEFDLPQPQGVLCLHWNSKLRPEGDRANIRLAFELLQYLKLMPDTGGRKTTLEWDRALNYLAVGLAMKYESGWDIKAAIREIGREMEGDDDDENEMNAMNGMEGLDEAVDLFSQCAIRVPTVEEVEERRAEVEEEEEEDGWR